MRILIDMDGILADLLGKWLTVYNQENDDHVTEDQITTWEVHEHVKIGRAIYEIPGRMGFFDNIEPIFGAIAGYKYLKKAGHELLICSSPYNPDSARAKYAWCAHHLGTRWSDVTLSHKKHWFAPYVDAIIDDKPETIAQFREAGKIVATLPYAYNEGAGANIRGDWQAIVDYFNSEERIP